MDAFDEQLTSSDGGDLEGFTYYFLSAKGNELFCEIDEEYILDKFNLTGISTEVQHFQMAFEMLTDNFDHDIEDEMRDTIDSSARHLYGLIHARYIITPRGLQKMVRHGRITLIPGREVQNVRFREMSTRALCKSSTLTTRNE